MIFQGGWGDWAVRWEDNISATLFLISPCGRHVAVSGEHIEEGVNPFFELLHGATGRI